MSNKLSRRLSTGLFLRLVPQTPMIRDPTSLFVWIEEYTNFDVAIGLEACV